MSLLSEPLPLRRTTLWGAFAAPATIPHRYGAATGRLLQYNASGTLWCWADHASERIDRITANGQSVGEWTWRNAQDVTGHPVTLVEFAQAPSSDADLIATGWGKPHPRTGARMDNPADVVWDILANLAGRDVPDAALADFRAEASALGLVVGGSIEAPDSAQTAVRALCASVGAIFCADAPSLCRVWPGQSRPAVRTTIDRRHALSAAAALDGLCNDLTVRFDFADSQARQSIQLEAPDSIVRYGRRAQDFDATWLTSARIAHAVAQRWLVQRARPQWQVTAGAVRDRLNVGDDVAISHPLLTVPGHHAVLSRALDLAAGLSSITLQVPAGDEPAIRLVRQSAAFAPQQFASVEIVTVGTERVLTLLEEDGKPIAQAAVTLDGTTTRYTDDAGRVAFPISIMPLGEHTLSIVTLDGRTLTQTVLVT